MIDALRRDAWPRGVRRQRRELEAAREELRRELGAEPSLADLAARIGSDEARLGRTIVRINTIESTSPLSAGDNLDGTMLPAALVPSVLTTLWIGYLCATSGLLAYSAAIIKQAFFSNREVQCTRSRAVRSSRPHPARRHLQNQARG